MFCWTRIPATLALFLVIAAVCPNRSTALAEIAVLADARAVGRGVQTAAIARNNASVAEIRVQQNIRNYFRMVG